MNTVMNILCYPFGYIMKWCWDIIGNYGLAIIVFTLLTKIVLLPISIWVHKNSIKMVTIQPDVNFLKANFYGNTEKIAEEEQKLQKKAKYSPALALIPLILQVILLMAVLYIVKQPLTHIFRISDGVIQELAKILGGDLTVGEDQFTIVRAILNGEFNGVALSAEAAEAVGTVANSSFSPDFLGIRLDAICTKTWGWYIIVPIVTALSSLFLCWIQNLVNVIQAEQGKVNKYGLTALSVGISLFLGFIAYTGVAMYWIASNIFSVIQQLLLNLAINPKKYVDYGKLEASRKALADIKALDGGKSDAEAKANRKREKQDYRRFFKIVNKHVVIYSERSGFYKYFESILGGLLAKSNLSVHYITNDPKDAIFKMAETNPRIKPYYIGQRKLITLMMKLEADIVIMTTPDLETYYIKRSLMKKDVEYIYIPHDMMSVHMGFRKGALDHFDTVFCTGPHVDRECRATEKVYGLPEKTMVPFGYPLAEKLEKSYIESSAAEKPENAKKEILIAPSWQEDNLLDSVVDTLITKLMSDDVHLTVRPHPEYVKRYPERIKALTDRYEGVPDEKLTFELDFTVNKSIYTSDLLVTDWSGIAYEFAFATKKPVLFVNTKMKTENPEWEKIGLTPVEISLRSQVGVALEKEGLEDNVRDAAMGLIQHSGDYKEIITKLSREHLYSYGTNGAEGVNYVLRRLQEIQKRKKEGK